MLVQPPFVVAATSAALQQTVGGPEVLGFRVVSCSLKYFKLS